MGFLSAGSREGGRSGERGGWEPACLSALAKGIAVAHALNDLDSYLMRTMTTDHAPFQINPGPFRFGDPRQV
jgi:hypothetical protein